jgi:hypothetical protein
MLKVDEKNLVSELLFMAGEFTNNKSNLQLRDVPNFEILNQMLASTFGKYINYASGIRDVEKFNRYVTKSSERSLMEYVGFFAKNGDDIRRIATQYLNYLRKIRYPISPYTKYVQAYSEEDFIDLILAYYSQFGDEYFNIVKNYFEENRINFGTKEMFSEHPAFFTGLQWIGSGYIFTRDGAYSKYSTLSAAALVHELGHAIDHENFIVKQQKNISTYSDMLSEVPSIAFESGFLDFIKDNYIDVDGSEALTYGDIVSAKEYFRNIKRAYNSGNPFAYCEPEKVLKYEQEVNEYEKAVNHYNGEYMKHEDEILLGKKVELPEIPEEPVPPEPLLRNATLYSLGIFFSLHLNVIRRSSIKDFKKVLHNIATSRKEASLEQLIGMTGFNYEDFVTGKYIKPQIDESAMYLKKKYPY